MNRRTSIRLIIKFGCLPAARRPADWAAKRINGMGRAAEADAVARYRVPVGQFRQVQRSELPGS